MAKGSASGAAVRFVSDIAPNSKEVADRAARRRQEGQTCAQIGAEFGLSASRVAKILVDAERIRIARAGESIFLPCRAANALRVEEISTVWEAKAFLRALLEKRIFRPNIADKTCIEALRRLDEIAPD